MDKADIDGLRHFSPRFSLALVFSVLLIELVGYVSLVVAGLRAIFEFVMGGLLLCEAAVLLRQARTIALFRAVRSGAGVAGVEGQARYARLVDSFTKR